MIFKVDNGFFDHESQEIEEFCNPGPKLETGGWKWKQECKIDKLLVALPGLATSVASSIMDKVLVGILSFDQSDDFRDDHGFSHGVALYKVKDSFIILTGRTIKPELEYFVSSSIESITDSASSVSILSISEGNPDTAMDLEIFGIGEFTNRTRTDGFKTLTGLGACILATFQQKAASAILYHVTHDSNSSQSLQSALNLIQGSLTTLSLDLKVTQKFNPMFV